MKIVLQINGGIGKSIAATAVCKAIKTQYPDCELTVISGYPEVFIGNPNVDLTKTPNELNYFYLNYIEKQPENRFFLNDPYLATDFIQRKGHLIKVWCEMNGIKYNGELPELFITHKEKTEFYGKFQSPKPILLIQTNGGISVQGDKYSWARDLPFITAQKVVNAFAAEYNVVQIRRPDQLQLQNVYPVSDQFRPLIVLIMMSQKRLLIDSFAQHAAAALGMPSVVCWIANTPTQFGYEMHTNIIANPPTLKADLRNSVLARYNISGPPSDFPYRNEEEIFDAEKIIETLRGDKAEEAEQTKKKNESTRLSEKIFAERNGKSMVAQRLATMLGKTELGDVRQILDIGSWHLGQSIEFSKIFTEAKIDAFEPVPESYQLCLDRLNSLDPQTQSRIRVHKIALSNKTGKIPFYPVDTSIKQKIDAGFSSMLKFNGGLKNAYYNEKQVQKEIEVQGDTLDNWCAKNKIKAVDIMWIDVQGAELLVFKGAEKILKNTRIIMTEVGLKPYYEGHTLKADIDKFLLARGFRELEGCFELNGFDYEANTVYVR